MVLADGEKHGYAIMQEVELQTNGQTKRGPGRLYGSIKECLQTVWSPRLMKGLSSQRI
jgi:DNA-binding PadR family transcriptional regulator